MVNVQEFVTARVEEDRAQALFLTTSEAAKRGYDPLPWSTVYFNTNENEMYGLRWSPEQVIKACDIKLKLINGMSLEYGVDIFYAIMAREWSNHPDFNPAWYVWGDYV